jgi:cyanophycinase
MERIKWLIIILVLGFTEATGQGRLLIVGGGAEKNGQSSWSTPAYKWAAEGKKVAIVGMSTGSLASYFKNQCGAAYAREFAINTTDSANSQATCDTLVAYDVIFFRGGDQYDYYSIYRNTKLQDAVNYLYSEGGTVGGTSAGMHILSSVLFTAKNGSVYPYECIENPNNFYVTLADDFFDFAPRFIFDTHFAERGRFGRLVGFLANYSLNQGVSIAGLGMDDMTCMTIDENGLGTVYGTGCANLYLAGSSYSLNGNKLLADTVNIIQLLQGCTYDFATGQAGFAGLDQTINSSTLEETGNYTILASGNSNLSNNQTMLADLVNNCGSAGDKILLLSGNNSMANSYKAKLLELGASGVDIFEPNLQTGADTALANRIGTATKILFLKNSLEDFLPFTATENGFLLLQKLKSDGMIAAFAGEDARLAGKTVVDNYLASGASYYAELTFEKGLSLLRHTVIMPDTYLNSDIYENTATAVPYAMVMDTLKYGIWLTNHNYMKFTPAGGKTILTGYGTAPVMVISNTGTLAGVSNQTSTGSTSMQPRMIAGFERLQLSLIDYTTPFIMGNAQSSGTHHFSEKQSLRIINDQGSNELRIEWSYAGFEWEIIDMNGRRKDHGKVLSSAEKIDVSGLTSGSYILSVVQKKTNRQALVKFLIKN